MEANDIPPLWSKVRNRFHKTEGNILQCIIHASMWYRPLHFTNSGPEPIVEEPLLPEMLMDLLPTSLSKRAFWSSLTRYMLKDYWWLCNLTNFVCWIDHNLMAASCDYPSFVFRIIFSTRNNCIYSLRYNELNCYFDEIRAELFCWKWMTCVQGWA